jgi:hypothetical protein
MDFHLQTILEISNARRKEEAVQSRTATTTNAAVGIYKIVLKKRPKYELRPLCISIKKQTT